VNAVLSLMHTRLAHLSLQEFTVFAGLASGESSTALAKRLGLSVKTVSTYRQRVVDKLDLFTNREFADLVADLDALDPALMAAERARTRHTKRRLRGQIALPLRTGPQEGVAS
jgi:DNA-binding CsgD family transcriptional regulator